MFVARNSPSLLAMTRCVAKTRVVRQYIVSTQLPKWAAQAGARSIKGGRPFQKNRVGTPKHRDTTGQGDLASPRPVMLGSDLNELLDRAAMSIRPRSRPTPLIGVVLGSGLGAFGDSLNELCKIPYADIPAMPVCAVLGHPGSLCLGNIQGVDVACLQGRVHLYEGYEPERVVFGVRLLARLGCKAVLITNAAGAIRPTLKPSDLMLIADHINLTGRNPLVDPSASTLGVRFPDMSEAYDRELCDAARKAAQDTGVPLHEGVYLGNLGPSYETPAEIRMARVLGADAVGMSTVLEVIALRHMRVRTAALCCITNLAAGLSATPLDHREVSQSAEKAGDALARLLARWLNLSADLIRRSP